MKNNNAADFGIKVKIKTERGASVPAYATEGAAACDLRASLGGKEITVPPRNARSVLVPTGLFIAPERKDAVAVIAARSGLALKHGVCLANGIGVVDSDYRGEILVCLTNFSDTEFVIRDNDRIAQLFFVPVLRADFIKTDSLDETPRGAGGFGSTGVR